MIVHSDGILSQTTHIPVGKFIAGTGKMVSSYAIYETLKQPVKDAYNAQIGAGSTITPLKSYIVAASGVIAGGIVGAASGPLGIVTAPLATAIVASSVKTILDSLPQIIDAGKAAGKSLAEIMEDVRILIANKIEDFYSATADKANNLLDEATDLFDDTIDAVQDLADELGMPLTDAHQFVPSAWLKTTTDMITAARTEASPLILDLDGDGIEVSALNSTGSVYWDVDNDGFREASSWVGKDDGLLALDINKNGVIDNHSELLGTLKTDGFTVLTGLDSNQNGMIDAGDTRFNDLRVWVDANSDGISQAAELKTLAQAGVQSISLNDTTTNQTINGNKVTHISTFTKTNGTTGTIADVWFNFDNVNARADNTTPINPLTLFLPNLRGFGRLADLSIAMSKDAALLSKVQTLTNAPLDTLFAPSFDLVGKMRDMLFTWAGVSGVALNARGNYVNAQELGFLEALTDQSFTQRNYGNPYVEAGQTLTNAFQEAFQSLMARFLVQTIAKDLFTTAGFYNPATDQFGGTNFKANLTAIDAMVDRVMLANGLVVNGTATGNLDKISDVWETVFRLLDETLVGGINGMTSAERTTLNNHIIASHNTLNITKIMDAVYPAIGLALNGTDGADTVIGGAGHDEIRGLLGNDILRGGLGNDLLLGEGGNDSLRGEDGDDTLVGGLGDDSYVYSSGIDTIIEFLGQGTDTIVLPSSIRLEDISLRANANNLNDLDVISKGNLIMRVEGFFNNANNAVPVERILFSDNRTIDLTTIRNSIVTGTTGNDNLVGRDVSFFTSDTIIGDRGNDTLNGGKGDDLLAGGDGNDSYVMSEGMDIIFDEYGTNDRIIVPVGSVVAFYAAGDALFVKVNGQDKFLVKSHLSGFNNVIEQVVDTAGKVLFNMKDVVIEQIGTEESEVIRSFQTLGASQNNRVFGNQGNDTIYTSYGDDLLNGGAGDDYLDGGYDNDVYILSADNSTDIINDINGTNDQIWLNIGITPQNLRLSREYGFSDHLALSYVDTSGNLVKFGIVKDYFTSYGNNRIETLKFSDGQTMLFSNLLKVQTGTAGNDTLTGSTSHVGQYDEINAGVGNDIITGGLGENIVNGGAGNDTYNITSTGIDHVYDNAGIDTVRLLTGTTANTTFIRSTIDYSALDILVNGKLSATLHNQFIAGNAIETIRYSDGRTLSLKGLILSTNGTDANDTIYGTDTGIWGDILNGNGGNDVLYSGDGNDLLSGGVGNDDLNGGLGNDVYGFESGRDTISDDGGIDTLLLSSEIGASNIQFYNEFNKNLRIEFINTPNPALNNGNSKIILYNHLSNPNSSIEYMELHNGNLYDLKTFAQLYVGFKGTSANDILNGSTTPDRLLGGFGQDTLNGKTGNDFLNGGIGDDTYVFEVGSGQDIIHDLAYHIDFNTLSGNDTLRLGSGISDENIAFDIFNNSDLRIRVGSTDQIVIKDQIDSFVDHTQNQIENLLFADGFNVDLRTVFSWKWATTGNDTQTDTSSASTIFGRQGNDTINGMGGNDRIHGGSGNDVLRGGDGNDTVHGGIGNDWIYGDLGIDTLYGGSGTDRFTFALNGSVDTVRDFKKSEGDILDIDNILTNYDPLTQAITDFVRITESGSNSFLDIDANGGANSFVRVAQLSGVTDLISGSTSTLAELNALIAAGNLII